MYLNSRRPRERPERPGTASKFFLFEKTQKMKTMYRRSQSSSEHSPSLQVSYRATMQPQRVRRCSCFVLFHCCRHCLLFAVFRISNIVLKTMLPATLFLNKKCCKATLFLGGVSPHFKKMRSARSATLRHACGARKSVASAFARPARVTRLFFYRTLCPWGTGPQCSQGRIN